MDRMSLFLASILLTISTVSAQSAGFESQRFYVDLDFLVTETPLLTDAAFYDDYSEETAQTELNFTGWTYWNVSNGTVDKVRSGDLGVTCQFVSCVDLDGTSGDAGLFRTSNPINLLGGFEYTFIAWISGNQRNLTRDTVNFGLLNRDLSEFASTTAVLDGDAPFTKYTLTYRPARNTYKHLFFENQGGDDVGAILGQVSLEGERAVPLPGALPLMLAAIGGLGLIRRRGGLRSAT